MDTAFKIRKHLTPPRGMRAAFGAQELRREVRREVSERVAFKSGEGPSALAFDGWTLNVSRGGVRAIIERPVALGDVFDVTVGLADASPLVRQGRVVWFQEEADGFIVGVAFLGTHASGQLSAQATPPAPGRGSAQ
jgi:hypothetical protein